jgi:hypothetical protein
MDERYLTSFENQATALEYTNGGTTLVSPQVSLVGADEVVFSKEIPNESKIRFAKDETTGKLYFVVDGVFYDALTLKKTKISGITYGEVDLGLPSGIIWADRNVGAETPQDNGAYFSWGNVEGVVSNGITKMSENDIIRIILVQIEGIPADEITQEMIDNIKLEAGEDLKTGIEENLKQYGLISGTTFDLETTPYYSGVTEDDFGNIQPLYSKYNETDGLTVLEAIDDAATANMGSDWRMPTIYEIAELVQNTDYYYIGEDGSIVLESELNDTIKLRSICLVKKGESFEYNNRSNFVEFPFAGGCDGPLLGGEGLYGYVWSSSVVDGDVEHAHSFYFSIFGDLTDNVVNRYDGCSIRGVRVIRVYYDITELVKKSIPVPSEGYGEGVDLGLSVKWADRNVGAENPWDNGAYFSWGNVEGVVSETTKKSEDDLIEELIIVSLGGEGTPEQIEEVKNNPEMMNEINAVIPLIISGKIIFNSGYSFDRDTYPTTLGGQYKGNTLDSEHDAATVNMGSEWRMPTSAETNELVENTDHYYIGEDGTIVAGPFNYGTDVEDKGLDGSKLRSICFVKKGEEFNYNDRSNFIEIPFAGNCYDRLFDSEGLSGYVWSSSVSYDGNGIEYTRGLCFDYNGYLTGVNNGANRYFGRSVRGVRA